MSVDCVPPFPLFQTIRIIRVIALKLGTHVLRINDVISLFVTSYVVCQGLRYCLISIFFVFIFYIFVFWKADSYITQIYRYYGKVTPHYMYNTPKC